MCLLLLLLANCGANEVKEQRVRAATAIVIGLRVHTGMHACTHVYLGAFRSFLFPRSRARTLSPSCECASASCTNVRFCVAVPVYLYACPDIVAFLKFMRFIPSQPHAHEYAPNPTRPITLRICIQTHRAQGFRQTRVAQGT